MYDKNTGEGTIGMTIVFLVLLVAAYFIGMNTGTGKVCDQISFGIKDESSIRSAISDDMSSEYLQTIDSICKW